MKPTSEHNGNSGEHLNSVTGQDKALERFKDAVEELLVLLRVSLRAPTAYMYWINRQRNQFVLESGISELDDVVFQDRVSIDEHFLQPLCDLKETELVTIGEDLDPAGLKHHIDPAQVNYLLLFPFVNNNETIALTVVEIDREEEELDERDLEAAEAYQQALANILKTYLELSDLLSEEERWQEFQQIADSFSERMSVQQLLTKLTTEVAALMQSGSAALLTRGAGAWHVLLTGKGPGKGIRTGMKMVEHAQVNRALRSGKYDFALHFNGNPKRISSGESFFEGASMAVPLDVHDRRQAVLIAWDENAMAFRESLKYLITDLSRIVSLQLSQARYGISTTDDMSTAESGAYSREFFEAALENTVAFRQDDDMPVHLVFISPKEYQILRTKYRLETLKHMQREMATDLNPNHAGMSGLVSFYSDAQFLILVHGTQQKVDQWLGEFFKTIRSKTGDDQLYMPGMDFYVGIHQVDDSGISAYDHIQAAKQQFNQSVKQNDTLTARLNG